MKSKVLKIIIILLLVLVILFVVNLVRNYIILSDITDYSLSLKDNVSNYYFKYDIKGSSDTEEAIEEYYYKDGIMLTKRTFSGEEIITWYNFNTNEYETIGNEELNTEVSNTEIYNEENIYELALFSYNVSDVIFDYLFKPITFTDNCYKIVVDDVEYYINKDTKLIERKTSEEKELTETMKQENTEATYELRIDCVTDEDVERPTISE